MTQTPDQPEAGPSSLNAPPNGGEAAFTPGPTPYHESSQFRHWRYSPDSLVQVREELNAKSVEIVTKNTELEKEAQISLGHSYTDPPPPTTYLTVTDELLLLRFYCSQISKICRHGFGLPEVVESTAISYLKRFYLKNSVMEWHPKNIMPTCLFLAAKTTNYPVLLDQFIPRFSKLTPADVLDTEFLVAQSLGFEFWVRGGEKALRGWGLDFQNQPNPPLEVISRSLSTALNHLSTSLLTDAEFIYTPSQIGLACWHLTNPRLVEAFLDLRYASSASKSASSSNGDIHANGTQSKKEGGDEDEEEGSPTGEGEQLYGVKKERLLQIVQDVQKMIRSGAEELDLKKVKDVDKRLKQCSNPEKVPGTALYIKRKREKEATEASSKAVKKAKATASTLDRDSVFGSVLSIPSSTPSTNPKGSPSQLKLEEANGRKPLSPKLTLSVNGVPSNEDITKPGGGEVKLEDGGMGIRGESGGIIMGGRGLKDVGLSLSED